jgi:hypothetical protein
MKQMLEKNPINRLCKFEAIRKHIWFNFFNWNELVSLNMKIPYFPIVKKKINIQSNDLLYDENKNILYNKNNNEEVFINYPDYINKNFIEYKTEKDSKSSNEDIDLFNKWFDSF